MSKKLYDLFEEIKLGEDYEFIKMDENLDEDFEVLDEGIKYFKASQRLNKLAAKLASKGKKELGPIIEKAKKAAKEFEKVEGKYEAGDITKAQARIKVDSLKRHYNDIMKIVRGREFATVLKGAGITALVGGIIASILFGFHPLAQTGIVLPSWDKIKTTLGATLGTLGAATARQLGSLKKGFDQKVVPMVKDFANELQTAAQ